MRNNPYYRELRELVFFNLLDYAKRKNLFLPTGKNRTKVNYLFEKYRKNYYIDLQREILRYMRNNYAFGVFLH